MLGKVACSSRYDALREERRTCDPRLLGPHVPPATHWQQPGATPHSSLAAFGCIYHTADTVASAGTAPCGSPPLSGPVAVVQPASDLEHRA